MAGGNNYGPRLDNRQRGNATQLLEKYRALARDAQQAGDRVTAEYYLQYAEHYYRVLGDYRDRQPEGRGDARRGRDAYDDDGIDGDAEGGDAGDDDGAEEAEARPVDRRDRRDDRARDDRPREDRQRDDRPREDRQRDDRQRDDGPREPRQRDDRNQDRRWDRQRDRRDRRPDRDRPSDRGDERADQDGADDRESLLQALPPPATMPAGEGGGRRLGLRRDRSAEAPSDAAPAAPVVDEPAAADEAGDAAPKRRGRPRKAAAEPAAE